jgi:hypothetical protein
MQLKKERQKGFNKKKKKLKDEIFLKKRII